MDDHAIVAAQAQIAGSLAQVYRLVAEEIAEHDEGYRSLAADVLHSFMDELAPMCAYGILTRGFVDQVHVIVDHSTSVIAGAPEPKEMVVCLLRMEADVIESRVRGETWQITDHPNFAMYEAAMADDTAPDHLPEGW